MELTYKAPCVELVQLGNLWFQLSNVSCNIKCKHCYLDCHHDIKKRNFLSLEKIQENLKQDLKNLKTIYLSGGEPFLHPNFNEIVNKSLKKANVKIFSNGTLISEKKLKILKSFEENSKYKISFILSLDHFTEGRNDEYRARGVFKKVLNSLKLLNKFNFEASVTCVNLKNEDESFLKEGFENLFQKNNILISSNGIKIIPLLKLGAYSKYYNITDAKQIVSYKDLEKFDLNLLDCKNSRVVTINGIYSCPALVNDPRGKIGEKLNDSSKKVYLETHICANCVSRNEKLFC